MQIDRLFQIVQILLNKNKVTAKELAEKFGVSTRTIYRDLDTLSVNGVPVFTAKGKGGGIYLMENYTMDRSVLTDEEKNSLLMGLETLKATQAEDVDQALQKFSNLFRQDHHKWIRVDFSHWGNDPKERQKFEDIKDGLSRFRAVSFGYYNAITTYSERKVYPLQLVFKEKAWYLTAYCLDKKALSFFKVMRMVHVHVLDEGFDPKHFKIEEDMLKLAPQEVGDQFTFKIYKEARYRIYDDFPREWITPLDNGDYQVVYYGRIDEWLYSFILSYGEFLEVLAPENLRVSVAERIENMGKRYLDH